MYSCTRGTLGMSPAQLADALWGAVMGNAQTGRIFVFWPPDFSLDLWRPSQAIHST